MEKKVELYSEKLNFEEALKIKKMINIIDNYSNFQKVYFKNSMNADFFSWYQKDEFISVSISFIRFGKFIRTNNYINRINVTDEISSVIENFIFQFYLINKNPNNLILQEALENQNQLSTNVSIPKIGTKKEFSLLTYEDAKKRIDEEVFILIEKEKRYQNFLNFLRVEMDISKSETFELVDISSLSGENQVGAVVAFKNTEKNKALYRKYDIKTSSNQNDYASLYEVTYRHFRNKLMNKTPFPDVFIVDGGIGQLNAVMKSLKELNIVEQKVFSLKKDKNHKTKSIIFIKNNEVIEISMSKLDQPIQDILISMQVEIHRFVIKFNISKRSKTIFNNSLSRVDFLSEKDIKVLYDEFETIHQMINRNEGDLEKVIGRKKAIKLNEFFKNLNK